jgi:hypothetical protein
MSIDKIKPHEWDNTNEVKITKPKALDKQVGSDHYKIMKVQPIEYIEANELGFCLGNVVKYITRHKQKGGLEDIEKAIHYLELYKELHYADNS